MRKIENRDKKYIPFAYILDEHGQLEESRESVQLFGASEVRTPDPEPSPELDPTQIFERSKQLKNSSEILELASQEIQSLGSDINQEISNFTDSARMFEAVITKESEKQEIKDQIFKQSKEWKNNAQLLEDAVSAGETRLQTNGLAAVESNTTVDTEKLESIVNPLCADSNMSSNEELDFNSSSSGSQLSSRDLNQSLAASINERIIGFTNDAQKLEQVINPQCLDSELFSNTGLNVTPVNSQNFEPCSNHEVFSKTGLNVTPINSQSEELYTRDNLKHPPNLAIEGVQYVEAHTSPIEIPEEEEENSESLNFIEDDYDDDLTPNEEDYSFTEKELKCVPLVNIKSSVVKQEHEPYKKNPLLIQTSYSVNISPASSSGNIKNIKITHNCEELIASARSMDIEDVGKIMDENPELIQRCKQIQESLSSGLITIRSGNISGGTSGDIVLQPIIVNNSSQTLVGDSQQPPPKTGNAMVDVASTVASKIIDSASIHESDSEGTIRRKQKCVKKKRIIITVLLIFLLTVVTGVITTVFEYLLKK
jgi:K+/H+ antiporter YhaU regulatory subunit KhtT